MKWLGLEWDEFHRQSEKDGSLQKYLQKLLDEGKAYLDDKAINLRTLIKSSF